MTYVLALFLFFILLLLLLEFSVRLGRYIGMSQLKKDAEHKLEIVSVAETAVFGLLGLLIAFTFSGAYDRYEHRKMHILEEANAFETAYEYVDLLPEKYRPILHTHIRQYLDLHLAAYNDMPNMKQVYQDSHQALNIQHAIWKTILTASEENPSQGIGIAQIIFPAINNMFDTAHIGTNMARVHPPAIIFLLLIGLAVLGAFLIGYNSADSKQKHPIHILCYVLLTAFVIYIMINIEFPRTGFVRFSSFDDILINVRNDMN